MLESLLLTTGKQTTSGYVIIDHAITAHQVERLGLLQLHHWMFDSTMIIYVSNSYTYYY